MNAIIEQIRSHRSIRKFKPDPVSDEQLRQIVAAAQAAPTSTNIQAYSVIGVRNEATRQQFVELTGGQRHIGESPLFLVWCADLRRVQAALRLHGIESLEQNVETFLLATIDATLAAQNATIAAESLGLGTVYIGGIRNNPARASELLQLPQLVYPVFGMCVGVPDQSPDIRPRLPQEAIFHEETYREEKIATGIEAYDPVSKQYYRDRTGGSKDTYWSQEMVGRFRKERIRGHMLDFLSSQGFIIK
ncbi:oxygen-insensitive NADPH nitroreductase [Paenibacillus koleovorans]|uniref:oxygen-insensitive NADPH nitroreductase n=1 Tax=Paenibacillus koleovorans TaxID=121608 RepID=UPI000FDA3FA0|nr:oxygen-insensitive NADPH nitroreductase [Paenibacillus koleovorans]